MSRIVIVLLVLAASQAAANPFDRFDPESWTVTCQNARTWNNTTAPNITNGAFQFTLPDGTEVRTTAGMNCYAVRNPAKVG